MSLSNQIQVNQMQTNSQAGQDVFVLSVLKNKTNGTFVEIGSNDPIHINNTYLFETQFNWRGIMVEYNTKYLSSYQKIRPKSHHVIQDATTIDYKQLFKDTDMPTNIDYLQIDLEVNNGSTLKTLEKLNEEVLDDYKFATITFEHDIYRGDYFNTRARSRQIFENRGYFRVFSDVSNENLPYEDWYVYPDLVDMDYIHKIKRDSSMGWIDILKIL
jgi:hypothetical protein